MVKPCGRDCRGGGGSIGGIVVGLRAVVLVGFRSASWTADGPTTRRWSEKFIYHTAHGGRSVPDGELLPDDAHRHRSRSFTTAGGLLICLAPQSTPNGPATSYHSTQPPLPLRCSSSSTSSTSITVYRERTQKTHVVIPSRRRHSIRLHIAEPLTRDGVKRNHRKPICVHS